MDRFIDCYCDNNYKRLIKVGTVKENVLKLVWENIFIEFCELTGTPHYKKLISLTREIGLLQSKYLAICACIRVLQHKYSYYCETVLKRYGYKYDNDWKNDEIRLKDIDFIAKNNEMLTILLASKQLEYDKFIEANKSDKPINREYFVKQIINLNKGYSFKLKPSEITVFEYVEMIKLQQEQIKQSNGREQ